MSLTVRSRARSLATFRWMEVRLMEMLARWVPTTPEMEVKVLFGQHLWDHARHADGLGRRTHELRAPLHHVLEPAQVWLDLLAEIDGLSDTRERLHAYYGILVGKLESLYQDYLSATDALLDAPSARMVTEILADLARMRSDHRGLLDQLPGLAFTAGGGPRLETLAAGAGDPVRSEATEARAPGAPDPAAESPPAGPARAPRSHP